MPALAQRAGTENQLIKYDFGQTREEPAPGVCIQMSPGQISPRQMSPSQILTGQMSCGHSSHGKCLLDKCCPYN